MLMIICIYNNNINANSSNNTTATTTTTTNNNNNNNNSISLDSTESIFPQFLFIREGLLLREGGDLLLLLRSPSTT